MDAAGEIAVTGDLGAPWFPPGRDMRIGQPLTSGMDGNLTVGGDLAAVAHFCRAFGGTLDITGSVLDYFYI